MDTSKTYIEMCNCPEIQKVWETQDGDVFAEEGGWDGDTELVMGIAFDCDDTFYSQPDGDALWLPRQDQLQEMLPLEARSYLGPIRDFAFENEMNFSGVRNVFVFSSMEQLWLAFVMKEKHDKVWNGEEWDVTVHNPRKTPRTIPPD